LNTVGVLDYTKYKYCLAGTDVRTDGKTDRWTYRRRKRFLDLLPPSETPVKTNAFSNTSRLAAIMGMES